MSSNSYPFVAVVIPTLNADDSWSSLLEGIHKQTVTLKQVLIIDSSSTDGTAELARASGFTVISISRAEFSHGGTRQAAAEMLQDADVIVYMTQDAIPSSPDSIARLIAPFSDPEVGATFGRQLPRPDAGPIETHARLFNYPNKSVVRTLEDRKTMGIRAAFLSNSFAAYRPAALKAVGGFQTDTITAEDTLVAARMLMAGWKTTYVADACVVHSHSYTIPEEFRRYFDTGVYHHREAWLLEQFGTASGEGKRFVFSELYHLWPRYFYLIPVAVIRTTAKAIAYYLGRHETSLSPRMRRKFSLNRTFWDAKPRSLASTSKCGRA